jgi:hypothetical protein
MKRLDFVIVCGQRSGSHLLASLLDSHPDITCWGEAGRPRDILNGRPATGSVRGAIVMYSQRGRLQSIRYNKVIHLTRNPEVCARSQAASSALRKIHGRGAPAHRFAGEPPLPEHEPNPVVVQRRAEQLRMQAKRFNRWLKFQQRRPYLCVTYEEVTRGGRNVAACPAEVADRLCRLLDVPLLPLTTNLRRSQG